MRNSLACDLIPFVAGLSISLRRETEMLMFSGCSLLGDAIDSLVGSCHKVVLWSCSEITWLSPRKSGPSINTFVHSTTQLKKYETEQTTQNTHN